MDFDRDHLWHPYSSMTRPSAPYLTESASGRDGQSRPVTVCFVTEASDAA